MVAFPTCVSQVCLHLLVDFAAISYTSHFAIVFCNRVWQSCLAIMFALNESPVAIVLCNCVVDVSFVCWGCGIAVVARDCCACCSIDSGFAFVVCKHILQGTATVLCNRVWQCFQPCPAVALHLQLCFAVVFVPAATIGNGQ